MKLLKVPVLAALAVLAACDKPADDRVLQGYVEGDFLRISAPEGGWLDRIHVSEGETVTVGAPLFVLEKSREQAAVAESRARLDAARAQLEDLLSGKRAPEIAQIEARLAEAQAQATYAASELTRQQALERADVAAKARLDQAQSQAREARARVVALEAERVTAKLPARPDAIRAAQSNVEAARAALDQADWRLSQRTVTAPAAGLVDQLVRNPGEWVPASGVVVSLLPPERLRIVFFSPERQREGLTLGAPVGVSCTGCPPDLRARIRFLSAAAEYAPPVIYSRDTNEKLVFRVEAVLEPPSLALHPGQPVAVRLLP